MKKFAIIFSTLILGFVFVTEAQALVRGNCVREPGSKRMMCCPAGTKLKGLIEGRPNCEIIKGSPSAVKRELHKIFEREERAFPKLTAYINDESKPAFQMLQKKLENKESVNWTEAQKAAFAEASGMNALAGANVVTAQKAINLRKDIEQKKTDAANFREGLKGGKEKLKDYMDEDDKLTQPLNAKAKAVDAAAENMKKESEDGKRERDAARDKKADNIGGPIWNHKEELKVAADKLEDVAKILESSKGFAKDAADKVFKEVGIDPTQLAKDMRTVAQAMGPMNDSEIDSVRALLKDRYDQAKREHDRIYQASAKDRAEAASLKKELDDADKDIAELDASRKWHDQFAENLVAQCGKDPLGCPTYLAVAAAERATAAAAQSRIGLLRTKQMFLMPIYMQKSTIVGFSDLGLKPHETIMEKLQEQIKALDAAKGKLAEHREAERKRTYQEYYDAAANHGKLKEEYNKMFSEYEKNTTLKDHLTYWKGWVEFEEERVAKVDEEIFKMERELAQLTGAPAPAAPGRSVQSLTAKKGEPAPLVKPREGAIPQLSEVSKEGTVPISKAFIELQEKMRKEKAQSEMALKILEEKRAAERKIKMAEHERTMAQKQKELAALEKKAAEAAAEAKRIAEETEVKKKEQEKLAKKKRESVPQIKQEPKFGFDEPLIAAPPPPPPPGPVYRAPPAPPSHEEVEIEKKEEEEPVVWRRPEPREEEATPQCDRGTWSPTFQRCIEDEAPEETARPDCGEGMHWSPTLKSCQPD